MKVAITLNSEQSHLTRFELNGNNIKNNNKNVTC